MGKIKKRQEKLAEYLFKHLDLFYEVPIFMNGEMTPYTVRVDGKVISYKGYVSDKPIEVKPINGAHGYQKVNISMHNKEKLVSIHRLVAEAFIPNPDNKPEVNHIDGNKKNNAVWNLEWVTPKENIAHAYRTGLRKGMKGDAHPCRKISADTARWICDLIATGKFSYKEIAEKTGSTYTIVKKIKNRERWTEMSEGYDFSKYDERKKKK